MRMCYVLHAAKLWATLSTKLHYTHNTTNRRDANKSTTCWQQF